jgi:hypothetical protein
MTPAMLRLLTVALACVFAPGPGSQLPLEAQHAPLPERAGVVIVAPG